MRNIYWYLLIRLPLKETYWPDVAIFVSYNDRWCPVFVGENNQWNTPSFLIWMNILMGMIGCIIVVLIYNPTANNEKIDCICWLSSKVIENRKQYNEYHISRNIDNYTKILHRRIVIYLILENIQDNFHYSKFVLRNFSIRHRSYLFTTCLKYHKTYFKCN